MRRFRKRIIAVCAIVLAAFSVVIISLCAVYGKKVSSWRLRAEEALGELARYDLEKVLVLCASENIEAGKVIEPGDLVEKDLPLGLVPENAILLLSDAVGRTAKIPLFANTYITADMLYEAVLKESEREIEYFCIDVRGNITKGSFVDIRICFEDGSDHVILSRKRVEGISGNRDSVILHVDEEELLRMGSAIADLKGNDERRIYAVEYPQGELQSPSRVDYVPEETVNGLRKER